jgi:O-antigen ligase
MPQDRWVGGIHPNIFSQASIIVAFSGIMILSGPKKALAILVALLIAYIVDSRYALATVLILFFGDFLLNFIWTKPRTLIAIGSVIVLTIVVVYLQTSNHFFTEAFAIYDQDRGLSSGFTGRDYNWSFFLPQLSEHPFFGYGFRNRLAFIGPHNGFMQYILENGLVISIPFLSALFFILISNISAFSRSLSDRAFQAHEGRVVLLTLLAIFFGANIQPQLLSFGDEFGPLTLLIILYRPEAFRSLQQRQDLHSDMILNQKEIVPSRDW